MQIGVARTAAEATAAAAVEWERKMLEERALRRKVIVATLHVHSVMPPV